MTAIVRRFVIGLMTLQLATIAMPALAQSSNDALDALSQFLRQTNSGRAQFTQVVTSPAKADQAPRKKTSSGTFEFQRPQQFRFTYQKPFVQSMVSDGQSLWLYDADLEQVTARKQAQALGHTPAALIAARSFSCSLCIASKASSCCRFNDASWRVSSRTLFWWACRSFFRSWRAV